MLNLCKSPYALKSDFKALFSKRPLRSQESWVNRKKDLDAMSDELRDREARFQFDIADMECIKGDGEAGNMGVYMIGIMPLHAKTEQEWLEKNWGSFGPFSSHLMDFCSLCLLRLSSASLLLRLSSASLPLQHGCVVVPCQLVPEVRTAVEQCGEHLANKCGDTLQSIELQ